MSRRFFLYSILAILFIFAASYQARHSHGSVAALLEWEHQGRRPFTLEPYGSTVVRVRPEAETAGLKPGDRIQSVGGAPLTGSRVLTAARTEFKAGGVLPVVTADGRQISIPVARARQVAPGAADWSIVIVLNVLMPLLSLSLGFWVALLRPRDPIAWLLLALLISFNLLSRDRDFMMQGSLLGDVDLLYERLLGQTWAIWMMLFGIYFPERLPWDRRWPWAKWLLIVPILLAAAKDSVLAMVDRHDLAMAGTIHGYTAPFSTLEIILEMLAVSIFFQALGYKTGTATAPDVRRRLLFLDIGASIGLTPMFLLLLIGLIRRADPFAGVPVPILVPTLLLLFVFPLTLAYVIVVHRALDVRVVLRQGIQYAFARRGVLVLRGLLWGAILLAISAAASRPNTRQVDILYILGVGVFSIVMIGRLGQWVVAWTDRRFFREAYDAEHILNELSEKVRTIVETGPLIELVARRLSESLHVPRVAFLLDGGGGASLYAPVHAIGYASPPEATFAGMGPTVRKLASEREPVRVYMDDPKSWINAAPGDGHEERASLANLGTQLLLPLVVNEKLAGFISLGEKLSEEPYSATDLRLLRSVATQAGLALENSRLASAIASEIAQRERLHREVEIAREVQERLFPQSLPEMPGLDYAGRCRPALGVGGDYYDFMSLGEGRLGIAIADVAGKGIGAALLMASLQASLRGQTIEGSGRLSRLITNVNRLVYEASQDNRYATFFYGEYDLATRVLAFVNAGHCPPIILRNLGGDREVIRLKAGGTVVGLFRDSVYKAATVTLEQGDLFVGFTDGISEAMNPDEEEWGEERLIEAASRSAGLRSDEVITSLMIQADAFAGGADQHDDMTLVVARVV